MSPMAVSVTGAILIAVAVLIGILVRFMLDRMGYALALAWAITAIGVEQSGDTPIVIASAFGMMSLIFVALWGFVKDR